ncbi:vanadium-dependent haloperoxidase [Rossellomorea aquimaris]|uniref:vanadium-dependent haloperoxidase n=1 Tax=Rossellomorea aquimaris TaxID=189382 RepID=UPI0007D045D8|nr:vanadium-dependent haloperoxidase [Rossellomorea aquimaris]
MIFKIIRGYLSALKRRLKAFIIRVKAALFYKTLPVQSHPNNGDEKRYSDKIANFSKGLPHNKLGEVDVDAYHKYIQILKSGDPDDFENLPLAGERKLVNPQAAYAFEMAGPDSHQLVLPPAPSFNSSEIAAEMVELYWQALTRDVPFNNYDSNPLTIAAAKELSRLSDFQGPKVEGKVTTKTLFRDNLPGALTGPYISQFLWKDIPYVSSKITQRYRTTKAKEDYLTDYDDWLAVQNGFIPPGPNYDPTLRYIRNGRDMAEFVHNDLSIESGLNACLILHSYGSVALDKNNPYLHSDTQVGFSTFGIPHILNFVTKVARPGLEMAWFQKWLVHRRLRPEEFGGRIHNKLTRKADYPIHRDVLCSKALKKTYKKYGSYLLPQAYPEGCPTHPSYPAGHSTFVGATVTILKAFYDETFVIPDPVVATSNGCSLVPYEGPPLTVGGELNKLAYNIAIGRDAAGVHYRASGIRGLELGEKVAIGILRDYKDTYNENFKGFTLTKFDGTTITI